MCTYIHTENETETYGNEKKNILTYKTKNKVEKENIEKNDKNTKYFK